MKKIPEINGANVRALRAGHARPDTDAHERASLAKARVPNARSKTMVESASALAQTDNDDPPALSDEQYASFWGAIPGEAVIKLLDERFERPSRSDKRRSCESGFGEHGKHETTGNR